MFADCCLLGWRALRASKQVGKRQAHCPEYAGLNEAAAVRVLNRAAEFTTGATEGHATALGGTGQ